MARSHCCWQTIEEYDAARDRDARRKMARVFNRTRETFKSEREYNDNLEEAESIGRIHPPCQATKLHQGFEC